MSTEGQKRSRAQYGGDAKRHRGARQLEAGMQGILITCNMNQRKCVGEAYSLLNAYAEELYGPEKFAEQDDQRSESEEEDDAEAALKKEVDQIRTSTQKNLRRFQSVESGANNVIFIKTHSIEPEKLVHHILKDLYTTKNKKSRVILRMLPFSGTCKAFLADMKKYAETFFQKWFKAPNKGTFQIVYKARNNNHLNREEVIKELAGFFLFLVQGDIGPKTSKPKKIKAPKIKEEDDVLVLTNDNFARALKEHKYLLVKFYIALSGPSQALGEEFSKAAGQLKKASPDVRFGKVDITAEKGLGKEFQIKEYPTLKLFVSGDRKNPTDCKGVRSAPAFITWLSRRTGSSTVPINSTEQAESFISSEDVAVIGFFKELHGRMVEQFYEAAMDVPELPFGVVSIDEIFSNYGITKNTITIFKKEKPVHYEISEDDIGSTLDLVKLIRTYNMDLVTEYNLETSVIIFDVPVESHILLFSSKSSETFSKVYENYESAAVEFRGKILFILVDTDETRNGRLFEYFRITEVDVPAVRILNLTSDVKYQMPADKVSFENLRSFCQSYLDGKAKPKLDSEEVPEDWDKKPVKELVGKTFNRVAFNKSSHGFIMFYAPWSTECKDLLPIWDELGRKYENHENITIARIDCTANDIQLMMLDRYPYFRYFPAGSDTQTVRYTGEKTLQALTEFLEQEIKSKMDEKNSSDSEDRVHEEREKLQKEEL